MRIGTIAEVKNHEYRVGLTPACVQAYTRAGHEVIVQSGAGRHAGFTNDQYEQAGAQLLDDPKTICDQCEMIVKVKEPVASEYDYFHEGQILYTYLHLAADKPLTESLMKNGVQSVAYETIEDTNRRLPCLRPMSEIAGRLSVQEGAKYLEKTFGGRGVLLGGVPGVRRGKIAILGGGIVGTNALKMAVGIGADVHLLDINGDRLAYLDDIFGSSITTLYSSDANIDQTLSEADVVIGAVLVPGAKAPRLVRKEHLAMMKPGAVLVDVAIDQGGCFETSKATTHDDPTYIVDDIVHYCVANMPGAVALTSTIALTSTTLPYGLEIANLGLSKAAKASSPITKGVNVFNGACTYQGVAEALDIEYTALSKLW